MQTLSYFGNKPNHQKWSFKYGNKEISIYVRNIYLIYN